MMVLSALTWFHVATGTIVLIVAPLALLVRKGGGWHKRWGRAFLWGMAAVLGTALFMWQAHGHLFLAVLAVVCAYLMFEGVRVIARGRRRVADRRANALDVLAASIVLLSALALFAIAATANSPLMHQLAYVIAALGALAITFAALDLRAVLGRVQTRLGTLLMHISAMIGAYISAVTAFCVINAHAMPMLLRWAIPSAVGSSVIGYYSMQYRRRFARQSVRVTSSIAGSEHAR